LKLLEGGRRRRRRRRKENSITLKETFFFFDWSSMQLLHDCVLSHLSMEQPSPVPTS
jgi:hypothetical protein